MASVPFAGEAYISDDANQASSGNKNSQAMKPDLLQFIVEPIVVSDETELPLVGWIFL
jgi:hypothetical protein